MTIARTRATRKEAEATLQRLIDLMVQLGQHDEAANLRALLSPKSEQTPGPSPEGAS